MASKRVGDETAALGPLEKVGQHVRCRLAASGRQPHRLLNHSERAGQDAQGRIRFGPILQQLTDAGCHLDVAVLHRLQHGRRVGEALDGGGMQR